jgi:hypothetical protein
MIIYSVTIKISKDAETDWLKWTKEVHIPDVMQTGYFIDWKMKKLLLPEDIKNESTFVVDYFAESFDKFNMYSEKEAKRLQTEHKLKFGGKYTATRVIYSLISK